MLLAVDTSLETCSACLYDGSMRAFRSESMTKGHAERLIPMIEELFKELDLTPAILTKIGVTRGPGSFTGLRVALSAARSMALALNIPAVGISSLQCLLNGQTSPAMALIDARHNHAYAEITGLLPAALYPYERLAEYCRLPLVGSGAAFFGVDAPTQINIENLAILAFKADPAIHPATPLYLKAADVTPQIKGRIALVELDHVV